MQYSVWLFDSECVLCECGVKFTIRNEFKPSVKFVSIQSEEGRRLALENNIDPNNPATFLFLEDGEVLEKSDGVIAFLGHLKGPVRWLRIGRCIPRVIRDILYDLVARNRYLIFGKTDACIAPMGKHQARFVL